MEIYEAQLNDMLQYAINNEKDYSILAMIGLTGLHGLRRSELCGLSWREADFEKRIIHVDWARVQISRRFTEFQNRMNKVRGKAGLEPIPHVRLHDMRHTFISMSLRKRH